MEVPLITSDPLSSTMMLQVTLSEKEFVTSAVNHHEKRNFLKCTELGELELKAGV